MATSGAPYSGKAVTLVAKPSPRAESRSDGIVVIRAEKRQIKTHVQKTTLFGENFQIFLARWHPGFPEMKPKRLGVCANTEHGAP
jgi:hypothetical protein